MAHRFRVLLPWVLVLTFSASAFAAGTVGSGSPGSCTETALNTALTGGGAVTFDCGGSAVTITLTSTKTIAADTTIDGGNLITLSGGGTVGLFDVNPGISFSITGLTLADGFRAGDSGAAIKVGTIGNGGTLNITRSTLRNNQVTGGGGGAVIIYGASVLTITDSTFSDNHAESQGAAIFATITSTINATNSTFANNGNLGGANGCIDTSGTVNLTNCTIANNTSDKGNPALTAFGGTWTLRNSIIANNVNGNCDTVGGTFVDGGNNIQYPDDSCGATIPVVNPDLSGLGSFGGPTQTMALGKGSPAIDAGNDQNAPLTDQRGVSRQDGDGDGIVRSDIGAFEAAAFVPTIPVAGTLGLLVLALGIAGLGILAIRS